MNLPCLLKFTEKYGDRLFLLMNKEDAFKAFDKVFRERVEVGYWYVSRLPTEPSKPVLPSDTNNVVEMRRYAYQLNHYESQLENYKNALAEFYMIEKIKESNYDVNLIVRFMQARRDYQYEGFEYEQFENYP